LIERDAAVQVKSKIVGGDLERAAKRFISGLVVAQFHVLNTEAVESGDKLRMDGDSAFELLDRFVSLICFN
jgi:hypothetical protein